MRRVRLALSTLLGLGVLLSACTKKEPKKEQPSFRCELLQQRVEKCAPQTLARVKDSLAGRKDRDQQITMFERRFKQRLADKKARSQCEKFQHDPTRVARMRAMKVCYGKPDCDSFAACMIGL